MSWKFYLEPLLIMLGQLMYDIEDAHTNRCLEWLAEHPTEEEEYQRRLGWGVNPTEKTSRFWDEAVEFSKRQFEENNHTRWDVVLWYRVSYYWSALFREWWFCLVNRVKPRD